MKLSTLMITVSIGAIATLTACSNTAVVKNNNKISFLAFGDGGYNIAYPKLKHLDKPLTIAQFIEKEKLDWQEDYRPMSEFDHAPLTTFPGTDIATELGGANAVGLAMAELCRSKTCEFGIQLGDNIYPDGADAPDGKDDQQRMNDLILTPLKPLIDQDKDFIVYSALGNHDWKTSRKGVALQLEWMDKQPNFHMGGEVAGQGYYSYKQGELGNDIEFFVIDSNMLLAGQRYYEVPLNPDGSEGDLKQALKDGRAELEDIEPHEGPVNGEDVAQLQWLEQGLRNSTAKWKMVYGHHILWSVGGTKYSEGHVLRRLIMPMLCQHADAYIAGHEHDLELLTDDCSLYPEAKGKPPLPLIISGAASKMRGMHSNFAKFQERYYPQFELIWAKAFIWGFAHIEVDNNKDQFEVSFYTTPRDRSGKLVEERSFKFDWRGE